MSAAARSVASVQPGTCQYCGCTEEQACNLPPCNEPCNWIDNERTVCSRADCVIRAHEDDMRKRRTSMFQMTDYLRGGLNRRRRKRKGKAA